MAAKTIKMAIALGVCCGPLQDIETNLYNELRDYIAHEVMKEQNALREEGLSINDQVLLHFFNRLFPANEQ